MRVVVLTPEIWISLERLMCPCTRNRAEFPIKPSTEWSQWGLNSGPDTAAELNYFILNQMMNYLMIILCVMIALSYFFPPV